MKSLKASHTIFAGLMIASAYVFACSSSATPGDVDPGAPPAHITIPTGGCGGGCPPCFTCLAGDDSCEPNCNFDQKCVSNKCVQRTCSDVTCTSSQYCVSGDCIAKGGSGATCSASNQCTSGNCGGSNCCSSATACAGVCDSTGACKKSNGQACGVNADCQSGSCADGFCCNRACTGQCEQCNATPGTCTTITDGRTNPPHGCPGGGDPGCQEGCFGGANYSFPSSSKSCGAPTCLQGVSTAAGTCNGLGACAAGASSPCPGGFGCNATSCGTTCKVDVDCAPNYHCSALGTCAAASPQDAGKSCSGPADCKAGLTCVDGVCCESTSCPTGQSCATPGREGTCTASAGSACTADTQCGSGHCVDGACCDQACDGVCQACDVAGSVGKCVAVKGAPHGSRTACPSDPSNVCATGTCNGIDGAKCSFPGATTTCVDATCSGSTHVPAATCDGSGNCTKSPTNTCGAYACDPATKDCSSTCTTDAQCATGFSCAAGGACIPKGSGASCSADLGSSIDQNGNKTSCAPYLCQANGLCGSTCASSEECASGANCDGSHCVATTAGGGGGGTGSSGGCSVAHRDGRASAGEGWLLALGLALGVSRRRRR